VTTPRQANDPAQEDRAWFGYHPRALAPTVAAVAVASVVAWTGRWYLEGLSALAARLGALAVFAAAWGGWVPLAAVFVYRTTTYTYRLTDRALVLDYGFWFRPVPPVALADVTDVTPRAGPLGRLLGVGSVEVRTAQRLARLTGVRCPAAVAEQIRAAAAACRKP
jgi:membrane protein YdbS with pleckstrin-like domain